MRAARDVDPGLAAAVPFRFACSRCGHCCSGGDGYAWLDVDEVEPLARALDMTAASFVALHAREATHPVTGERRLALRERGDGRCTLLEGRNTCRAYTARPRHCRDFPYWPSVMAGGAGFEAARATCPGIAVLVPGERAVAAFALLAELYAALDEHAEANSRPTSCCLDTNVSDELFMSALEADYAAECARASAAEAPTDDGVATCRLGRARPLGCRGAQTDPARAEQARARLRAIERETGHPVAYGAAHALLAARGVRVNDEPPESRA